MATEEKKSIFTEHSLTIFVALLGAVATIIAAYVSKDSTQQLESEIDKLNAQLERTISAPTNSDTWEQNGQKHRYWVCKGFPDPEKAEEFCESLGGHLATITSSTEQTFVKEYVQKNAHADTCLWIGIEPNNGQWNQWVTDEPFDYENWNERFPEGRGEHYLSAFAGYDFTLPSMGVFAMSATESADEGRKVKVGEWILLNESLNEQAAYNIEGWLICEWDY